MPLRFEIDRETGVIHTTGEAVLTGRDLSEYARRIAAAEATPLREIIDVTAVDDVDFETFELRRAAEWLAANGKNRPGTRIALVGESEGIFGLLRLAEAYRAHPDVESRVFRSREQALRWLGAPEAIGAETHAPSVGA